jgi:hypothetical protein
MVTSGEQIFERCSRLGDDSVIEHLPSMHEASGSIPNTEKTEDIQYH